MEKVVITGRGLITPLGNGLKANEEALLSGRSGIVHMSSWEPEGLESLVAGKVDYDVPCSFLDRKANRFTPSNAKMALVAAEQAIGEAGLSLDDIARTRIAVIGGCGGSSYKEVYESTNSYIQSGRRLNRVSPYIVPRVMPSSAVACLSLFLGITGESYDVSCACASGTYAIMLASRLIRNGEYDIVIAGGSEELSWSQALGFTAMRALSRKYNDSPEKASRPFDKNRDGFVIAEGAGIVVLESEKHAMKRGVKPIAEISGWGANSNASDMVVPDTQTSANVMKRALDNAKLRAEDIDYINTHGTATLIGDPVEMRAVKEVFGDHKVAINSTKSQTGHMIGATGASETIFCSMMIEKSFISPSINLEDPEDEFKWANFVLEPKKDIEIRHAINNSFAFGGSNACLVISKYK